MEGGNQGENALPRGSMIALNTAPAAPSTPSLTLLHTAQDPSQGRTIRPLQGDTLVPSMAQSPGLPLPSSLMTTNANAAVMPPTAIVESSADVATDSSGQRPTHKFTYNGKTYSRKKRVPLSKDKRERLEEAFKRKEVPRGRQGTAAKLRLAKELAMDPKEVNKWFDNRRTKESLLEKRIFDSLNGLPPKTSTYVRKKAKLQAQNLGTANMDAPTSRRGRKRKSLLEGSVSGITPLLQSMPSFSEPPESVVQDHFKQINQYFNGSFDLKLEALAKGTQEGKESQEESQEQSNQDPNRDTSASVPIATAAADGSEPTMPPKTTRKGRVTPTLTNVLETIFSPESCFYPLVQAVEVLSSKGYLDTLIRRVLHENATLRSFFMWYVISKYSGDRISGAVFRCFTTGLAPAIGKISLLDVLENQIPELLDGSYSGIRSSHALFSNEDKSDSSSNDSKPLMDFLNKVFVGKKVTHKKKVIVSTNGPDGETLITGNITKVLVPTSRSGGEPRFRVFYAQLDLASTVQWNLIKQLIPDAPHI